MCRPASSSLPFADKTQNNFLRLANYHEDVARPLARLVEDDFSCCAQNVQAIRKVIEYVLNNLSVWWATKGKQEEEQEAQ